MQLYSSAGHTSQQETETVRETETETESARELISAPLTSVQPVIAALPGLNGRRKARGRVGVSQSLSARLPLERPSPAAGICAPAPSGREPGRGQSSEP